MAREFWRGLHRGGLLVAAAALIAGGTAWAEDGFKPIFNGTDLEGWDGDPAFWRVEDGAIIGETTEENAPEHNTFLIWRDGEVDDFELRFSYRIHTPWANSGVQVRSEDLGEHRVAGYQPDIATEDWITGIIYEERGRGILARRGEQVHIGEDGSRAVERFAEEAALGAEIREGDWNEYHVIAQGNTIRTKINGRLMHALTDDGPEARDAGIVAFQLHTGPPMTIAFRDIALKRLPLSDDRKKVALIAGTASHGYAAHEHNAGMLLLNRLLNAHPKIVSTVYTNGWPSDPTAFDNVDAVAIYADGGGGHPLLPHLASFEEVMARGTGLVCMHYAVIVDDPETRARFLDWIGGYHETHWSVNPHWHMRDPEIGSHPAARGLAPYDINDEWYYHMRFRENLEGVTPILSALPPEESLSRPDGPHSNNPHVRAAVLERKEPQVLAWAAESVHGGRGFGYTGGHTHWNWGHPMHRKLILNAIAWAAGLDLPEEGMPAGEVTLEDLKANQDYDPPENYDFDRVADQLAAWRAAFAE